MKRQNGFTIVEGLLIVFVVLILGSIGWYVLEMQKPSRVELSDAKTNDSDDYAGWKEYCSPEEKACFKYPNDWTLTDSDGSKPRPGQKKITSPTGRSVIWTPAITQSEIGDYCDQSSPSYVESIYFRSVSPVPKVGGLYVVETGYYGDRISLMKLDTATAKTGSTGRCDFEPFFLAKNSMIEGSLAYAGLSAGYSGFSDEDKAIAKKILLSYTY